jgi:predicted AlkP superfamily phosphohydrolase/phosphomutase
MRLLIIGLDSMPSDLLNNHQDLPNIKMMIENGFSAILKSCEPPITIPAWMVMMTSKNPGKLGVYGFRHRKGYSYTEGWIATSSSIKEKKLWDYLAEYNKRSCLIGVPPTYPPYKINGLMISCFITPTLNNIYTYPPTLKDEIERIVNEYKFDIKFRVIDRDKILEDLYDMTEKRFKVINYLMNKEKWDLFMFVEIGVDRLHHTFWKYYDKNHPKYISNNKYEHVVRDYYRFIDSKIGELIKSVDDDTLILVVSDHGTTRMKGCFCINEWLIREGYLKVRNYPDKQTDLDKADIDWSNTKAWGWGGYYARIFINLKGREANGIIDKEDYENLRRELREKILNIKGPNGERFNNKVYTPEELYGVANGDKPDLIVYFDDLYWRSAGTIGHNTLYLDENDTGPDDSVHSYDGIFILYNKSKSKRMRIDKISIYDVTPTLLALMNIPVSNDMEGKVINDIIEWHNT